MSKCPFHEDSAGQNQEGEIVSIRCKHCGEYRISKTALDLLKGKSLPSGWLTMLTRRALVSTRDTRLLHG